MHEIANACCDANSQNKIKRHLVREGKMTYDSFVKDLSRRQQAVPFSTQGCKFFSSPPFEGLLCNCEKACFWFHLSLPLTFYMFEELIKLFRYLLLPSHALDLEPQLPLDQIIKLLSLIPLVSFFFFEHLFSSSKPVWQ